LRAVAIELETVQRFEGEGAIDPVGRVLAEIEDDVNRTAGLGRVTGRFGNRGDCLAEGGSTSPPEPRKFAMSKTVAPVPDAGCAVIALLGSGAVARNEAASEIARRRLRGFMRWLLLGSC
jgi:hypothetical protein